MAANQLRQWAWRFHKILAYLLFAQLFIWVAGGLLFATLPFQAWVKGADYVAPPAEVALPAGWQSTVTRVPGPVSAVRAEASAQGILLAVESGSERHWFSHAGDIADNATASQVERFGRSLLKREPAAVVVRWIDATEHRLGIVDELAGATGLWQMAVDNDYRLYFSPEGRYLKVRTDYWVWFDALWRLHIMDYSVGKDFNNGLLRVFSWLAIVFVISGLALTYFAARQQWRRRQTKKRA